MKADNSSESTTVKVRVFFPHQYYLEFEQVSSQREWFDPGPLGLIPSSFLHMFVISPGGSPPLVDWFMALKVFLFLSILIHAPHSGPVDPCGCTDAKATDRYRSREKHSTDFLKHTEAGDTITCGDIIAWQNRYMKQMKRISRHTPAAPRVKGTPEDSLYTLTGRMYYVRHESKKSGDCDLHIEIETDDPRAMRAIVEVTNDN